MTFHLHVADGLRPLASRLADELSRPGADPFDRELVAVPGDGVRAWLTTELGRRLGALDPLLGDGIVANVEFVFPGVLVRRALGEQQPDGEWSVGQLTWAVYEVMAAHGDELGLPLDAVRARDIADLFDRYALHRTEMVRGWERGRDVDVVGLPLPEHLRWQPRLWRHLVATIGRPSDATQLLLAAADLRLGRREPLVPERVFLFGLASVPLPHLHALAALSARREVHVFTPVASIDAWQRVRALANEPIVGHVLRSVDPSARSTVHPLAAAWGRASRESQLLLTSAAIEAAAEVTVHTTERTDARSARLLDVVQRAVRHDEAPPGSVGIGTSGDARALLDPDDRSIQWHRCHGPARQAEVLRDVILRLLELPGSPGRRRLEPRDIVVLTPDVSTFAPLVDAVFAGDPDHGVPAVPVRVADRSLRQDNPVLDGVAALLDLIGGRFRVSEVLAFAARAPVRRRFGFGPDELGRLAEWAEQIHVHWGLDVDGTHSFGLPADVSTYTWRAGLDQLLVGAAMAPLGPRLGPGGAVPFGDVEGEDVETAGAFADLLHHLGIAQRGLSVAQPVATWCTALGDVAADLFAVPDAESWQWRDVQRTLTALADEAVIAARPSTLDVPPAELAALLTARLTGRPGRASFMSGAVTLSSLTAQRGVPHRVVCLVGLDGDLGTGAGISIDDLMLASPCVGDRDPRSELRAQMLDAVLAAEEHLVVCTTGRDLRTNADVPPSVPVAELVDVIDATARTASGVPASRAIAVDHPRQAWSEPNFRPGALDRSGSAWSFDRGALDAALVRRRQGSRAPLLAAPLASSGGTDLELGDLLTALRNPFEALLRGRLGMRLDDDDAGSDDLVPLSSPSLDGWRLANDLLQARLAAGERWSDADDVHWERVTRARGALPPLEFGTAALVTVRARVDTILAVATDVLGPILGVVPTAYSVDQALDGGRKLFGEVGGVRDTVIVDITASRLAPAHLLSGWLRLAALSQAHPDRTWRSVMIGRGATDDAPRVLSFAFTDPAAAHRAVALALDLLDRARTDLVPMMPATAFALHRKGRSAALKQWKGMFGCGHDRWVQFALGEVDLRVLLDEAPHPDECGDGWGIAESRFERWAYRVWSAVEDTLGSNVLEVLE